MADEPPTRLHAMVGRASGALRRLAERLGQGPVQQRLCPECGATVATEPTESSIPCPECRLGERDG